jgi:tyrosine-specific transport protein
MDPAIMRHEPGTVLGAMTLVAGTTVGAGILALPAITAPAGFGASAVALIGGAGFNIITGLLLVEVNINTMCELGSGGVSIVSMANRTLGKQWG